MEHLAQPAMDAGRHHDCARDRGKRPAGLPRRQPTRPGDVLRPALGPQHSAELRPTHLPRLVRPTLLPELGPARRPRRRQPANGGLERPRRQAPTRTRRRAVHPSSEFRRRWQAHDVRTPGSGVKHLHHHLVGDLELAYESLDLRAAPGLTLTVYAAEPDSPTAHAISLLGSLAATETEQNGMRQSGLATS